VSHRNVSTTTFGAGEGIAFACPVASTESRCINDFAAKTHRRDAERAENFKNMRGEA
jgi:hypothetical protein